MCSQTCPHLQAVASSSRTSSLWHSCPLTTVDFLECIQLELELSKIRQREERGLVQSPSWLVAELEPEPQCCAHSVNYGAWCFPNQSSGKGSKRFRLSPLPVWQLGHWECFMLPLRIENVVNKPQRETWKNMTSSKMFVIPKQFWEDLTGSPGHLSNKKERETTL